jgi:hypothetical protein
MKIIDFRILLAIFLKKIKNKAIRFLKRSEILEFRKFSGWEMSFAEKLISVKSQRSFRKYCRNFRNIEEIHMMAVIEHKPISFWQLIYIESTQQ